MATSRLKLISGQAYLYTGSEGIYQVITGLAQELTGQSKVVASGSLQVTGSLFLMDQTSAPTPGGAEAVLYARAGTLYFKNSGGSETAVGSGGGSISDGDKGDITVSASGATWTIDGLAVSTAKIAAAAVTYAKIQNVSASDKILGRSTAGAGSVEEITCTSAGRALIDDADASAQRTTLGLGSLAVKSTVATTDIDNDTVTYAKIQNVSAADKLLGRVTAGAGDIEEVTCTSAGRALLDDADASAQRTTLGLGTIATQSASSVSISGGSITGITDLAIADGGTGASDAPTARVNLGLGALATLSSVSGTFNDIGAKLVTTASLSVAGAKGFAYDANSAGTDVIFFVSGSTAGGANSTALVGGRAVVSGNLAVHGGSITTNAASFNLANTTPTTVTIGDNAANLYLGKSGANRVHINGSLLLNNNEIQASGGSTGLTFPSGNSSAQFAANLTVVGDLGVNGGDLTTSASTFNLLNATATSINFAGAGTTINVGASTGFTNIKNKLAVTGSLISSGTFTYMNELYVDSISDLQIASNGGSITADKYDGRRYVRIAGSNPGTVYLPVASTKKGRVITFVNSTGASVVTVARDAQDTANILGQSGSSSWALDPKEWFELVSTGNDWIIVCGGVYPNQSSG
jgi:hypothetical protein